MGLQTAGAISFTRALDYSPWSLARSLIRVGLRVIPRTLTGRATIIESETVREVLGFFTRTAPAAVMLAGLYGGGAAFVVGMYTTGPGAFHSFVLPQIGGAFLDYVIPFAIANLVVLKGVVGLTSDIASMRVAQETDALEAAGVHPADMVFAPRALALVVTAPALAVLSVYAACLGAWTVLWTQFGTGLAEFAAEFAGSLTPMGMVLAVVKLGITAGVMAIIAGAFGFAGSSRSAGLVGTRTTAALTTAVVAIILVNGLLGALTAFAGMA